MRLACRSRVALFSRWVAVALALEVVHEHDDAAAGRQVHRVLGAVAAEDRAVPSTSSTWLTIRLIGNRFLVRMPDIDAAVVVAVDHHHVRVERLLRRIDERCVGEVLERDAVLRLDHAEDVGADVADHLRRVLHRELVDALAGEVDPADPVDAAVGDDLDAAFVVAA